MGSRRRYELKGFSLVELLVVVSIIMILLGILMPMLTQAKHTANRVKCADHLKQIGSGLVMYTSDNDGFLPPLRFGSENSSLWYPNLLAEGDYLPVNNWRDEASGDVRSGVWLCPGANGISASAATDQGGGYAVNSDHMMMVDDSILISSVARSTRTWLIGDAVHNAAAAGNPLATTLNVRCPECDPWPSEARSESLVDRADPRHANFANVGFVDHHVETRTYPSLQANDMNVFLHE